MARVGVDSNDSDAVRRYRFFLFTQLLLILFLPFLLMIALGGFIKSSAVILWSLLSPLGALLFDAPRRVAQYV
jgi:guanylate cyclase